MKKRKIALLACCISAIAALLLPCFASAANTMEETATLPAPFNEYTFIYKLPNISFVYYRVDTDVRANSLPVNVYVGVREQRYENGGEIFYTTELLFTTTENGNTITLLNVNSDDFENEDSGRDYKGFYSSTIPAYLAASGASDYAPRYHTGIFSLRFNFPVYAGIPETLKKYYFERFDTYSITNENVSKDMSTLSVYNATDFSEANNVANGRIKGLTTIRLYNSKERADDPDTYEKLEFSVFTGAVESAIEGEEIYYFSGDNDFPKYEYDRGYYDGLDKGRNESYDFGYNTGYNNGYNEGKLDYYEMGYGEGYLDGQNGAAGVGGVARSIFATIWGIIDTPIAGVISVADILLIIVMLAVLFFFLRIARGG